MKPSTLLRGLVAATLLSPPVAALAQVVHDSNSVSIPADQIGFGPTGVKTNIGELMAGPAYGDLTTGRHGTLIRMPAGFVSPVHNHTEEYFAVVIEGVGANGLPGSADIALPEGSYWFQRGEEAHVTKCLSAIDCLFFIVQPGKFDYVPAN